MKECREGYDLLHPAGRRHFYWAVRRAFMYVIPDTLGHFKAKRRLESRIPCPSCGWKCDPDQAYCSGCGRDRNAVSRRAS